MATISDIARLAGVSTATVSHVINSTHFVSEPIREQVLQVVQQLNYHPSTVARSLRTKATHSIGLIISDIELPFFATLVRGVQDVSARHGRTVLLANTDEAPEQEAAYIRMMWGKRVDGLIIAPTGTNAPLLAQMQGSGLPVVSVDRHCPGLVAPHVGIDNIRAAARLPSTCSTGATNASECSPVYPTCPLSRSTCPAFSRHTATQGYHSTPT